MSDETTRQLTLLSEDSPAKICQLPENGRALLESGLDYGSSLQELLTSLNQVGLSSKMSPVFYPATKEQILPSSFNGWRNGGMAFAGGYLTLSISEYPNDAEECSLLQVLETDVAQKYYLSKKACEGILRRAKVRGKQLPELLQYVLEKMVEEKDI